MRLNIVGFLKDRSWIFPPFQFVFSTQPHSKRKPRSAPVAKTIKQLINAHNNKLPLIQNIFHIIPLFTPQVSRRPSITPSSNARRTQLKLYISPIHSVIARYGTRNSSSLYNTAA